MPPPQLAADAPVADVLHPVEVNLGETLRNNIYPLAGHCLNGRFRQRFGADKPLLAGDGLNHGLAADAVSHGVGMRLNIDKEPVSFQVLYNRFPAGEAVHTDVRPGVLVHGGVVVEDVDEG
ncbi:hypothetical protein ES703_74751 [subsurface metagenome]